MRSRFEIEYTLNTPVRVLYDRLSTPEGLSEWFADNVTVEGDIFTFFWDKTEARARLVYTRENKAVKFEWLDFPDTDSNFFEFRIVIHELTNDTALLITDHAEENEVDDARDLWDTQISYLRKVLGLTD
ncbi:MAG: START-like domain-containing protein [Bacteroidales bacterium]|jgi:uncharacterized protein YndB with AHSA1/START domain|nr:START-like domain-containing protein [Bacteroidales bacterium]